MGYFLLFKDINRNRRFLPLSVILFLEAYRACRLVIIVGTTLRYHIRISHLYNMVCIPASTIPPWTTVYCISNRFSLVVVIFFTVGA